MLDDPHIALLRALNHARPDTAVSVASRRVDPPSRSRTTAGEPAFFLGGFDFIVPARKGTRLPGVRLRIRSLTRDEVIPVEGLPTLTVERTIADLVEIGTDLSLVAGCVRDAVRADKLVAPYRLVSYLSPIATRRRSDGTTLANDLFELAGVTPGGWDRD